jgi:hypothetical protein
MSLRESITQNPRLGTMAACGLLLLGLATIFLRLPGRAAPVRHSQAFFSTDDGKTWFADNAANLPPFDKDGKQAVRAHVYRCADGTEFVSYLERFKPQARQALEFLNNPDPSRKVPDLAAIQSAYIGGREVKRPGETNWTDAGDFRQAVTVTAVKCPDGSAQAVAVEP